MIILSVLFLWIDFILFDIEKQTIQFGKFFLFYTRKERLKYSIPFSNIQTIEINQDVHEWNESVNYNKLTFQILEWNAINSQNTRVIPILYFPKLGKI